MLNDDKDIREQNAGDQNTQDTAENSASENRNDDTQQSQQPKNTYYTDYVYRTNDGQNAQQGQNPYQQYNAQYKQNGQDTAGQQTQDQANSGSSYSQPYYNPYAGGQKPKKKKHAGKVIGIIALCVCFAFVFGAVGLFAGGMIYKHNTGSTVESSTPQTNGSSTTESTGDTGNTDKHFNVYDASVLPDTADKQALSVSEIYDKCAPSVVYITTTYTSTSEGYFGQNQTYSGSGAGSGVVITEDGYIITNNHVIEDASEINVQTFDGKEYKASLVGTDSTTDIAVIKIDATGLTPVTIGNSDSLVVGELAVAIGNPLGKLTWTTTAGVISALDRSITFTDSQTNTTTSQNLLQFDAAINSGNSGGALINSYGELVGVVNAKASATGVEGLSFAIPIDDVKDVINELVNNGYVTGRPLMGITTQDITEQIAMYYNMQAGVYVYDLDANGAAAKAGIQREDIIIALAGKTVTSTAEMNEIKNQYSAGDTVDVTVVRDGKEMTFQITFDESKPETVPSTENKYEDN